MPLLSPLLSHPLMLSPLLSHPLRHQTHPPPLLPFHHHHHHHNHHLPRPTVMLNPQAIPFSAYPRPIMYYYQPSPSPPPPTYYTPPPYFASWPTYITYPHIRSPPPPPPTYTDPFPVDLAAQMSGVCISEGGGGGSPNTPHQTEDISEPIMSLQEEAQGATTSVNVEKAPEEKRLPPPPRSRFVPLRDLQLRGKNGWVWLPRSAPTDGSSSKDSGFPTSTSPSPSLEFDESHRRTEQRTTVMLRNVPNKLSRDMLIRLLDEHCVRENEKEPLESSPLSEYDFVYLPMDFRNKCNLGYAFVNFTTSTAAWRVYESLHGCKWGVFASGKITHVCYARIQGKAALMDHFRRSWFQCDTDEYLPAVLSPPRDGSASRPAPSALGKRAKLVPC